MSRDLEPWRRLRDRAVARSEASTRLRQGLEAELAAATAALEAGREAQAAAQSAAQLVQEQAHARIASLTAQCLRAVFGPEAYDFAVVFERKRGRTEASLVLRRGGRDYDAADSAGGGVVDVASFALRLACLMMNKPPLRRFLALDEPFKHLSEEYRPAARALLEQLSGELQVQIVMVTHDPALAVGDVVQISS
jgi:predicted ATPase